MKRPPMAFLQLNRKGLSPDDGESYKEIKQKKCAKIMAFP